MTYVKGVKLILGFFAIAAIVLTAVWVLSFGKIYDRQELAYGVTFSSQQAKSLGLDWQELFTKILDELGAKKLRLVAYWNEVEPDNNNFYWEGLDWQINEASQRGAEIILAIGGRLPRWPECHYPDWTNELAQNQKETETLEYIKATIERYKSNKNIVAWQIENEPFLSHFGECPELNSKLLDKEIVLARSLDTRPIVVTDSGELSLWVFAAKRADIFGTTMYRDTYSKALKRYIHYPIAPGFFHFKKNVVSWFAHPQEWIVIELQAEPWGPKPFQDLSQADRDRTMTLRKFKEMLEFARLAGFKEFYLWGVEYWYWDMMHNNNPGMWEEAKKLFTNMY